VGTAVAAPLGVIRDAAPAVGAWVRGALIGLGLSVAAAALSQPINNQIRFFALLVVKLFEFYPVGAAGILIGGIAGVVWNRMR
jgi:hypothetical protein